MEFFHKTPNIQFLAVRKPALVMSLVVLVVCVASLAIRGLNLGVEFTGGVTVQVSYPKPADLHTVRGELAAAGYPNAIAQNYGNPQEVLIRLQPKKGVSGTDTGNDVVKILQKADPQQLAKFIQGEHPQTIALVMAHLEPRAASTVLGLLPEKIRTQAVKRLARMQQFSPEVVQRIAMVLHTKLESLGEQKRRSYGGVDAVAELMNRMDMPMTKSILEMIEKEDAQLAVSIRNSMFTFEDLVEVPDASIWELVGQGDKKTLAIAMKGASEQLKGHLLKSMSSRAAEIMKEDMEALGPMRSRDVHQAQQEVVNLARQLESQGKMILKSETEEAYVV